MACYQPLKAFVLGLNSNGKKDLKICSNKVDHIEQLHNGSYIYSFDKTRSDRCFKKITEFIEIPCGRCIGCRLAKSKDWANRCMLETEYHDSNLFVTLTYRPDTVPMSKFIDDDGVINDIMTCRKRDFQLFMKRLRKAFPEQNIRYFACTEYGEKSGRPHCHAILFGLTLPDLIPIGNNRNGDALYTSAILEKIWKHGLVSIGNVTFESAAYVARYVTKKQYGKDAECYERLNIEPESCLMSLKPAIGKQWFDEHPYKLFDGNFYLKTENGGRPVSPPRYFKKKMEDIDPDFLNDYQLKNEEQQNWKKFLISDLSDSNYYDILETQGRVLENKTKILLRDDI